MYQHIGELFTYSMTVERDIHKISKFLASVYKDFILFCICLDLSVEQRTVFCALNDDCLTEQYFHCLCSLFEKDDIIIWNNKIVKAAEECRIAYGYLRFLHTEDLKEYIPKNMVLTLEPPLGKEHIFMRHLILVARAYQYREDIVCAIHNSLEQYPCDIAAYCEAVKKGNTFATTRTFFDILQAGTWRFSYSNFWERIKSVFEDFEQLHSLKVMSEKYGFLHFDSQGEDE